MKQVLVLLVLLISLGSCSYEGIGEKMEKHKDEYLFLSFWPGMSQQEFEEVKEIEEWNGNLKYGGKFIFEILNKEDTEFFHQIRTDYFVFDLKFSDSTLFLEFDDPPGVYAKYDYFLFYSPNEKIFDSLLYSFQENYKFIEERILQEGYLKTKVVEYIFEDINKTKYVSLIKSIITDMKSSGIEVAYSVRISYMSYNHHKWLEENKKKEQNDFEFNIENRKNEIKEKNKEL